MIMFNVEIINFIWLIINNLNIKIYNIYSIGYLFQNIIKLKLE